MHHCKPWVASKKELDEQMMWVEGKLKGAGFDVSRRVNRVRQGNGDVMFWQ